MGGPMALPTNLRWRRPPSLISENVNNSRLDEDICTKFYGKMHHRHAQMTTWPKNRKLIRVTSSNEGLEDKCVDLSDYNRYLNQIWYITHIPHYKHAGMAIFTWPENPRWRLPPSWISEKCQYWIKISAPKFMGRCITAMRRWPRDQKSKPEVNSRDVIK